MDVKVTAVSFKDVCDLLLVCKQDHIAVEREDVRLFASEYPLWIVVDTL